MRWAGWTAAEPGGDAMLGVVAGVANAAGERADSGPTQAFVCSLRQTMAEHRSQHFLARSYLREFADRERKDAIWQYRKSTNEIRLKGIHKVACGRHQGLMESPTTLRTYFSLWIVACSSDGQQAAALRPILIVNISTSLTVL